MAVFDYLLNDLIVAVEAVDEVEVVVVEAVTMTAVVVAEIATMIVAVIAATPVSTGDGAGLTPETGAETGAGVTPGAGPGAGATASPGAGAKWTEGFHSYSKDFSRQRKTP